MKKDISWNEKDGKFYDASGKEVKITVIDYSEAIRPLNSDEKAVYASAVTFAVSMILPSFRDALSILRPFYDLTSETAYTDKHARVGLGPWFFSDELSTKQRASVLLHESMHVLNDHFVRGENYDKALNPSLMNIAGDFEINCALDTMPTIDLSFAIFPDKEPFDYKRNLIMEEYLALLRKDNPTCPECGGAKQDQNNDSNENQDGSQSSSSQGSPESENGENGEGGGDGGEEGNSGDSCSSCGAKQQTGKDFKSRGESGKGCGNSNEGREKAADDAGIERASEAEKKISKRNTAVRIKDELTKSRQAGTGHMTEFFEKMTSILTPPKVDWRVLLKQVVSSTMDITSRGRQDYSYRRVNRRFADSKYIFPGMVQYEPTMMLGIDTSGSMQVSDYSSVLSEIESIIKTVARGRNALKVFTVDTEIANIQTVSSTKEIDLVGGGGTRMATAFEFINQLPRREAPDIFVLATDAGLFGNDWAKIEEEIIKAPKKFVPIILVTDESTFNKVPESLKQVAKVIDISEK